MNMNERREAVSHCRDVTVREVRQTRFHDTLLFPQDISIAQDISYVSSKRQEKYIYTQTSQLTCSKRSEITMESSSDYMMRMRREMLEFILKS